MRSLTGTLVVKYLIVAALSVLILPAVARVLWPAALWIALVVTGVTYVLGDRIVLAAAGNAAAVVADFAAAVALYWASPLFAPGVAVPFGGALTVGGAVAVAEILFHQFLLEKRTGVR